MATLTIADLDNGKRDLQTVDAVANSRAATATTRHGQQTTTLYEAIRRIIATGEYQLEQQKESAESILRSLGYSVPVEYAPGLSVTNVGFTVMHDGVVYAADPALVPFSTGDWNPDQWYPIQNTASNAGLLTYPTKVAADAAAAGLPSGQRVLVEGDSTLYSVQSGGLSSPSPVGLVASVKSLLGAVLVAPAVAVAGYFPDSGVGGGTFRWDASASKSLHNGGTVISPSVPWDGARANLGDFLNGVGETDPDGSGCYVRVDDGRQNVAVWGAAGNDIEDDTASILAARKWFDDRIRPTIFPKGFKCLVTSVLPVFQNYRGMVWEGDDFQPYSYQNWGDCPQGIRFDVSGGIGLGAAITIDALAPVFKNFALSAPFGDGFAFDICSYSGLYENIRVVGFNGSSAKHGQGVNVTEPIFNKFKNCDFYSSRYGHVVGRDSTLAIRSGAPNENTYINCRWRGNVHTLWITKQDNPISYGTVFINCIFQETAPIGSEAEFFDIIKFEGGFIRGVQFIGGRVECTATAGRKTPRIDVSGIDTSKPLLFWNGTYIHSTIVIHDPNDVWGGTGDVYNPRAKFPSLAVKTRIETPVVRSPAGQPLELQLSENSGFDGLRFETSDSETKAILASRYATAASPVPQKIVSYECQYRDGNQWRLAGFTGRVHNNSHGLWATVAGAVVGGFTVSGVRATNAILTPPASATPANNGEVTFQLTSNTSLTFRVKGSDGVVRSGSITLA